MNILVGFLIASIVVLAMYILLPWGFKLVIRWKFLRRAKCANTVFLTFDDGPNPESTPKILDLLREADAKATFFVLGKNVENYPNIAKSIIDNGHEIGEHSYQHLHAWKAGPIRTLRDLTRGGGALRARALVGDGRTSFRPPYGKVNLATLLYVWLGEKRVSFWNIDPEDYAAKSAKEVAERVIPYLNAGDVILLHDGRNNRVNNLHVTIHALSQILDACKRKGLRTSTIKEGIT